MNPKTTLILIAALVILGGYVYIFEFQGEEQEAAPAEIYGASYGEYDIVELAITGRQGTAHFVRTDNSLTQDWEMRQPAPVPPPQLDQSRVNGAATRLAQLSASQVITGVTDLAQYGLDSPVLTVTLTISDGQKITLLSGARTPVGGNRYVRLGPDARSVYLVFDFAVDDLARMLEAPPFK
jgi:hypothetical protein